MKEGGKKTKALIFDIGQVLIFYDLHKMVRQISCLSRFSEERILTLLQEEGIFDLYGQGQITTNELYEHVLLRSERAFSIEQFAEAVNDVFRPNDRILPLIHKLKEKKIPLLLLSNTCDLHYSYLKKNYPFLQLFDHALTSHELRTKKPHPKIFLEAINRANALPEECFYTDDILEFIQAAQKLCIDAELFTSTSLLEEQLKKRKIL